MLAAVVLMLVRVPNVPSRTTVPVKRETLKRLRLYKIGGTTYDEVLNDFMDDNPPDAFVPEHLRRLRKEPDVPWREVRKRLRL